MEGEEGSPGGVRRQVEGSCNMERENQKIFFSENTQDFHENISYKIASITLNCHCGQTLTEQG